MATPIFEDELLALDHRTMGSREEALNTADRLGVEIGLLAGRADRAISGDRKTGIDALDNFGIAIDAVGVIRSSQVLEQIDSAMARTANLTVGVSSRVIQPPFHRTPKRFQFWL